MHSSETATTASRELQAVGEKMYELICDLYPICRSISGNGVRDSLRIVQDLIPVEIHEVRSGTAVFDWSVPKEWNVRTAYVKDAAGTKVIDFDSSNLHVLGYSVPFNKKMSLEELRPHLFTLPEHPDWVPYRTSYYSENWGFCLSHNQLLALPEGEYEVVIESSLTDGCLTYGEYFLKGESDDEVLISTHICHPSMANDNLSGMALATILAKELSTLSLRYSYRFLFTPGTIGSITWLSRNEDKTDRIKGGLILACVGDPGPTTYKKSRQDNAEIDRAACQALKDSAERHRVLGFSPYGYDERQFCSPGFNLPVGCLTRTPHGQFPEYHTSADNLEFVQPKYLAKSFSACMAILRILENNRSYLSKNPKCEPCLGKRGLYRAIGGQSRSQTSEMAMLWVLNLSDGSHSLLDIAERSGMDFESLQRAAQALVDHSLLTEL